MAQRQAQAAAQMGQGQHHHLLALQQQQQRQRQAQAAAGVRSGPLAGSMMALMTGAGFDKAGPAGTAFPSGEGGLFLEDDPPEPTGPPLMDREVYLKNSLKCAKCFKVRRMSSVTQLQTTLLRCKQLNALFGSRPIHLNYTNHSALLGR
jgi:phage FluMu protein Com